MNSKVKLKIVATGEIRELTFEMAESVLQDIEKNRIKSFEIAEPKKFKFIDNALIKLASPKVGRKTNRKDGNTEGSEVSE